MTVADVYRIRKEHAANVGTFKVQYAENKESRNLHFVTSRNLGPRRRIRNLKIHIQMIPKFALELVSLLLLLGVVQGANLIAETSSSKIFSLFSSAPRDRVGKHVLFVHRIEFTGCPHSRSLWCASCSSFPPGKFQNDT
jgi:hypothetical protein